jgi:hypothetical protein
VELSPAPPSEHSCGPRAKYVRGIYEDNETTMDQLKARLAKTVAYLKTLDKKQIDASAYITVAPCDMRDINSTRIIPRHSQYSYCISSRSERDCFPRR